jgi:hypothetical protein
MLILLKHGLAFENKTWLRWRNFTKARLEMIIPPGATPAQLQALDQVRAYARRQKVGFKLMVRS